MIFFKEVGLYLSTQSNEGSDWLDDNDLSSFTVADLLGVSIFCIFFEEGDLNACSFSSTLGADGAGVLDFSWKQNTLVLHLYNFP